MRALLFVFLAGVVMSTAADPATGQEKKDPGKAESYDEKVTVRYWDGTKFLTGVKEVPAFRHTDKDGTLRIWTQAESVRAGNPVKGSEIIDKDGNVYVCEKSTKVNNATVSAVKLKPKDK